MRVKNPRRLAVVAWPALVAGLVLGACGGSEASDPSRSTINLGSTAFVTRPPETTTTTIPGQIVEGLVQGEQEYTVQSGDYALRVADIFGISLDDLEAYNGWADANAEFPFPGSVIKIPPGANDLAAPAAPEGVEVVTGGEAEQPVGESIPEAGDNCGPGKHVIQEGDLPIRVAELYDVSLDALNQANASVGAYRTFIPGEEIIIPAKADCAE